MSEQRVMASSVGKGHGDLFPCGCKALLITHDVHAPQPRGWWKSVYMYECDECGAVWLNDDWCDEPEWQ